MVYMQTVELVFPLVEWQSDKDTKAVGVCMIVLKIKTFIDNNVLCLSNLSI